MCCEGDADCDAVMAAWSKAPGSEAVWERVAWPLRHLHGLQALVDQHAERIRGHGHDHRIYRGLYRRLERGAQSLL